MEPNEILRLLTNSRSQYLRWGIFAFLVITQLIAANITHLNLGTLIVLMGVGAATNTLIALIAPQIASRSSTATLARRLTFLLYFRIALDLLLLLAAIRVTGGIESPFLFLLLMYLFQLNMEAGPQVGLVSSLSALLALGINAFLELYRVLPHLNSGLPLETEYSNALFIYLTFAFLAIVIYVGVDNSYRVTAGIRARESNLARSTEQLTQRVNELTALRDIGSQLTSSLELDSVLEAIGQNALRLADATDVHIFLYDASADTFGNGIGTWSDGSRRLAIEKPRENGLSRSVLRAKQPIIIDDVASSSLYSTTEAQAWRIQSIAGFPITKDDRMLGVLNVAFETPHRFREDEQKILLALADQAALAINNASLYTQVEQRARELGALYRVAQGISQYLDPERLLQEALTIIQEVLKAPIAIAMLEGTQRELILAAQKGLSPSAYQDLRLHPLKVGEGFAGNVIATGEPIVTSDARNDPLSVRSSLHSEDIRAMATVPIKFKGQTLGALQVARNDTLEFSESDVRLLNAIVQQIAVALENARLYGEVNRRADELKSLREIGLATTSTLDLREQFRLLHTQVSQLIHADTFFVGLYDEARQEVRIDFVNEEGWELRGPVLSIDSIGLSPWVVRNSRALRIDDMEQEQSNLPTPPRHETKPAQSWLGVPLLIRNRVIGLISVQSFKTHAFTPADERFLTAVAQHAALAIENARLYETSEIRARELILLNEISRAISASLDLNEIFLKTVRGLADAFGYQLVRIYLLQGKELELKAQIGYTHPIPMIHVDQGVIGRVARTAQVAFVHDATTDADFMAGAPGVNSEISVPLVHNSRILGVLDVEDRREGALTEEDVKVLSTFGEQIAIAITNAELYRSVVERERFASSLRRIALTLTSTRDSTKVLEVLCHESLEFFGVQGAYVWLLKDNELVGIAAEGENANEFLNMRMSATDSSILATQVIQKQQPLFLNDVPKASYYNSNLRNLFKIQSLMGAPLIVDNQPVGVLTLVDQRNPQRFDESDLERVMLLANQAGAALANARLFEQARDRVAR